MKQKLLIGLFLVASVWAKPGAPVQVGWQGQAGHGVVNLIPQQNAQEVARLTAPGAAHYAQLKTGQEVELVVNYRCEPGAAGLSVHVRAISRFPPTRGLFSCWC